MRIECGPIELRLIEDHEADQLFALAREEQLTRFLQWPAHRTPADSHAYIADARRLWARRTAFLPGIFLRSSGELIGAIGLSHLDHANKRAEVGTWLGLPWQGKGYNAAAKAAIFRFAFDALGLYRLELYVRTDNEQSRRSLEHLPGLQPEGTARARIWQGGEPHDALAYAITAPDFQADDWPPVELGPGLP